MSDRTPFLVKIVVEDTVVSESYSYHNFARTLCLAAEQASKIPSAYVGIWYKGKRMAELSNNWRGELAEADVTVEKRYPGVPYAISTITPLNPHGPIFRKPPINARAEWRFTTNPAERHALLLCGTGDYRLDGIPLAFGGDPAGTAARNLEEINGKRAIFGLAPIVVTNTILSRTEPTKIS